MGEENFLKGEQMILAAIGLHLAEVQHRDTLSLGLVCLTQQGSSMWFIQLHSRSCAETQLQWDFCVKMMPFYFSTQTSKILSAYGHIA